MTDENKIDIEDEEFDLDGDLSEYEDETLEIDDGLGDEYEDSIDTDDYDDYGAEELGEDFEDGDESWDGDFDEEFDDQLEDGEFNDGVAAKKKTSKGTMVIIGAGAVFGLLVIMFMMGGGDKSAPVDGNATPPAQVAATGDGTTQPAAAPAEQMPPQPNSVISQRDVIYGRTGDLKETESHKGKPTGGILNNKDQFDEIQQKIDDVEFSSEYYEEEKDDEIAVTPDFDMESMKPASNQKKQNQKKTPQVATEVPSENKVLTPMPDLGLGQPVDETVEAVQTPAPPPIDDTMDFPAMDDSQFPTEDMADNTPQMPDMMQQDEMPSMDNNTMPGMMPDTQTGFDDNSGAAVDSKEMAALNKKLDLLFARLDHIENKVDSMDGSGSASGEIDEIKDAIGSLEKKVSKLSTSKPKYTPSKPKNTSSSTKSSSASKAPDKVATAVSAQWSLRAAQPGSAMVSRKGQSEIRDVSVGDNLDGIGKITNISLVNGRWVIQGTKGQVTQ